MSPSVFHLMGNKRLIGSLVPRAILVIIAAHYIYNNVKSKQIIKEKEKAELQLLKSQIAPHFLFNTLNSLYSLAIVKSDKTAQSILDLSSLMRYVISETQEDNVLLKNEINHLQNYINLQKTRLTNETIVNFTINGNFDSLKIAPLLLIIFVENAFKYGVSTEEKSTISIDIKRENDTFIFSVENDKMDLLDDGDNTKIGLKNVKNRLNLIYGKKHRLTITENEKSYHVNLEIELV
ncbi:MAG: sensor histidine kinase [Crocinitomicaceae bacterium]|nr:histidine kinase [Flavobacteriales bacterium]NQZ34042.1 sensor histidine kinase [Crocinitomicaceae bacterium]